MTRDFLSAQRKGGCKGKRSELQTYFLSLYLESSQQMICLISSSIKVLEAWFHCQAFDLPVDLCSNPELCDWKNEYADTGSWNEFPLLGGWIQRELGVDLLLLHVQRSQLRQIRDLIRKLPLWINLPLEVFQVCPTGRRPHGRPFLN